MSKGFFRGHEFDEDQPFQNPILKSAAGLVHADLELDQQEPHLRDIELIFAGPAFGPRLRIIGERAEHYLRAVEEILGFMGSIELDAHDSLGVPNPRAPDAP
jgi:hypothetical protein